ncbi:MAG: phosphoribosyl-AMP cyclohydrolase [Victivallaceae bacterium]|nr:phosphoribosyl-AMP cyclohydrolase [Victivallaceae bacterium]
MKASDNIDFSKSADGLIPAVAQDAETREVLMVAYVNREALEEAIRLGEAVYYSRSRRELWHKGATSGHVQKIRDILVDCDCDTIIYLVEQTGAACHTGSRSCFFRRLKDGALEEAR